VALTTLKGHLSLKLGLLFNIGLLYTLEQLILRVIGLHLL
jgi:hypothetical protein